MNNSVSLPSSSWKVEVDRVIGCRVASSKEENSCSSHGSRERMSVEGSETGQSQALANLVALEQQNRRTLRLADMDPQIWGNLPFHLLESVLAWLPISCLLKLRCVCKRFNNILYSPTLWETSRRIPSGEAWYLFRGEGRECAAFNPEADSWCKLPMEFLPSSKGRVVAAAGGLLCVRQGEKMIVCNPLSKAWLELPPKRNTWKFPIVGMVMNAEVKEYKVVVAGSNSESGCKNLVTEIYSSRTKTWKLVQSHPVQHLYQTSAIYCNGFLYSAGFDAILAYDLGQELWREMKGPAMQDTQLMLPQICECNGCLLMVEVVSEHFLMTRVSIWALRQVDNQWFKMTSMPQKLLEEVISISGTRLFTYFGYGDLICFTIARRRVLVFSLSRRMWRWLPRCPFLQGFARRFTTLAYEPRVEAMV